MRRTDLNVAKGHKGFMRRGRVDPSQPGSTSLPESVVSLIDPAPAPPNYQDAHAAYVRHGDNTWARPQQTRSASDAPLTVRLPFPEDISAGSLDEVVKETRDPAVLAAAARHPNIEPESLHYMAARLNHADYEDVLCRIGENRSALPKTMMLLANSSSEKVKVWAAWHDNTPADCHVSFRDHPNAAVRQGTAENPGTPEDVLLYMGNALYEGDGACRTAAKANSGYPDAEARLSLAQNPQTPRFELEMLAWDTNAHVRRSARERLGTNRPAADELAQEARRRRLPSHVVSGIAHRKKALEDKTADIS